MQTPVWLKSLLENPEITDICIQADRAVFIDDGQGMRQLPVTDHSTSEQLKTWTLHQLSSIGKSWDARYPFIDANILPSHRLHAAFPPVAHQGLQISIRRLPRNSALDGKQRAQERWGGSALFALLSQIVGRGDSLIISGATGSGKTTLASDLLAWVPHDERIIALEDTPELAPGHPHFLTLVARPPNSDGFGEITLRTLLKQSLRMRPDRIILGECRSSEVLDLLLALNTGHRGALATLHANSPRDAMRRLELLCLLSAGSQLTSGVIRDLLAQGIGWVAQLARTQGGSRYIKEIWKIEGREGDTLLMRPALEKTP